MSAFVPLTRETDDDGQHEGRWGRGSGEGGVLGKRITEWERSGQTQREFCAQRDLALSTFPWWRMRGKRREAMKVAMPFLPIAMGAMNVVEVELRSRARLRTSSITPKESGSNTAKNDTALHAMLARCDAEIAVHAKGSDSAPRARKLVGIGTTTYSALAATIRVGKVFKTCRQSGAWLGLTPRQISSGGKTLLGGISLPGNVYLLTPIIQGA